MLGLLVQWNVETQENIFRIVHQKIYIRLNKYYAEQLFETTGIEIQSKHWGRNRKLSMEVIGVEYYLNTFYPVSNETKQ